MAEPIVIGLLHPGEMGVALGHCLIGRGHQVLWASAGRGRQTAGRALASGLSDVGTAAAVAGRADVIVSVCPPHAALDVARSVPGFSGTYGLFDGTALEARIAGGGPWSASAVKMAYAAWTKGSAALLLAARELAESEGVDDMLTAEWQLSQPGLVERHGAAERSAASKGWRWTAEMHQIAATMAVAGLPDGFHLAAAEIFARFPRPVPESGRQ